MEAEKITILNKLHKKDSITGLDIWYKKILNNIPYKIQRVTAVENNQVHIGQSYSVLFPFCDEYKSYDEWKLNPDSGYTVTQGDLIFIGIEIEENVTPKDIALLKTKYSQNVCEVRSVTEVIKRPGINYQLKVDGV